LGPVRFGEKKKKGLGRKGKKRTTSRMERGERAHFLLRRHTVGERRKVRRWKRKKAKEHFAVKGEGRNIGGGFLNFTGERGRQMTSMPTGGGKGKGND